MDNLTKAADSCNQAQNSAAANRIVVVGACGKDRTLIKRLLLGKDCSFLNTHQFEQEPTAESNAVVYVQRQLTKEPLPAHFFTASKRTIVISDCVDENCIAESLYSGADYYFDINESERILSSRFEAALRSHSNVQNKIINYQPYSFHMATRTLYKDDLKISLTHREFELALYLFSNQGDLVKDSDLLTWVWGLPSTVGTRRINTTMYQVSKKMRLQSASTPWHLKRFYAQGYRLIDTHNSHH